MNNLRGWMCPHCESIFSPHMMECKYCNKIKLDYADREIEPVKVTTEHLQEKQECSHDWKQCLDQHYPSLRCNKCGYFSNPM